MIIANIVLEVADLGQLERLELGLDHWELDLLNGCIVLFGMAADDELVPRGATADRLPGPGLVWRRVSQRRCQDALAAWQAAVQASCPGDGQPGEEDELRLIRDAARQAQQDLSCQLCCHSEVRLWFRFLYILEEGARCEGYDITHWHRQEPCSR